MTRTTEHTNSAPAPITTPVPAGSDPLLQLEYETQTPAARRQSAACCTQPNSRCAACR
ncbi:hypothetical protein [Kitasatospora sp. NBC_01300]|uniref:hypothetical protein n=1 Tax=Kitasatospora sp. NBC_01300 TaxID=2903574 RepID=UPI002F90806E|nr:hypothetical protein OG556_35250 [Kitasatospora sp. NBC_01300]